MRCVDVNVLVYAHRPESPGHQGYAEWLDAARRLEEPLGVPTICLSGFLRVVTHPQIFRDPTPTTEAMMFVEALRESPNHLEVRPGARHWDIFAGLCRSGGASGTTITGNAVPDAYLAALAIENGATWFTADRGFGRFPGLRWRHPFDDAIPPEEGRA